MSDALGYLSDLTSREAWDVLADNPKAQLIDVRTHAEWTFVGLPDLASLDRAPLLIEWQRYPDMAHNVGFAAELSRQLESAGVEPDTPLLFLCRSGGRSAAAARVMAMEGFTACSNVADGFEGPPNASGQRGLTGGWKASQLPWRQG